MLVSVWDALTEHVLGKVLGIDFLLLWFGNPQLPSVFNKAQDSSLSSDSKKI